MKMSTCCIGQYVRVITTVMIVLTLSTGCGKAEPMATSTDTPVPPTATAVPPTATSVPPTDTPEPTATVIPMPPLSGSGGGVLAFTSDRSGNPGIYVMNADGSDQRLLTDQYDSEPDWSPDGTQIAFMSLRPDRGIYTMNADGSNLQRLTKSERSTSNPDWSPDGTRIAFIFDPHTPYEVHVMDADGSNLQQLTDKEGQFNAAPDWSPDGTQITFVSARDDNDEIYVMNANGSEHRRLTNNDANDWWPAWSPDGSQIVFASNRGGNYGIYVMSPDGSNLRQLTDNDADDWRPAWSPDGTRITFQSNRDGNWEIYVMHGDGADQRRLTDNDAKDSMPAWRPTATASTASQTACDQARQIVQNGSFDSNIDYWEEPYGRLVHKTSEYNTGPGAAQVITSDASGSLDYRGTFGQCIDLSSELDDWPESDGQKYMTLEAYLKTDANIASASLNGIFLKSTKCSQEQVGYLSPPLVSGDQGWTRVSDTVTIPDTANSIHVFVWATGVSDSATVYVDDIRACSPGSGAAQ